MAAATAPRLQPACILPMTLMLICFCSMTAEAFTLTPMSEMKKPKLAFRKNQTSGSLLKARVTRKTIAP